MNSEQRPSKELVWESEDTDALKQFATSLAMSGDGDRARLFSRAASEMERLQTALTTAINDRMAMARITARTLTGAADEPTSGDFVTIPKNEAQAELMLKLSYSWMESNAPHRLRKSEPPPEHPDKARLDWLNEQPVHFIELDDFSIIDVRGLDVRAAIDERRAAVTKEESPGEEA